MDGPPRGHLLIARLHPAFRPTLGVLLGAFLVIAVVSMGRTRLFGDSDPALHVATGKWILEHREIPRVDPFSGTWAGKEWFAHEWLADVLWAEVHRAAGWPGLVALSAAIVAAAHVLLYRFLVRTGAAALVAFLAVVAAAATASSHWLARPHLLTVLLLVLWIVILEDVVAGRKDRKWLALLPLLMLLWVNVHGGFLVGLGVLACYVAGSVLERRITFPLVLATVASVAATGANPYGFSLPVHLVRYFATPRVALMANEEFASASIADRAGLALFGFVSLAVLAIAVRMWTSRRGTPALHAGTVLAFGATTLLAFSSIRHAEVVAILGAVVLGYGLTPWFTARTARDQDDWEKLRENEAQGGGAWLLGALGLLVVCAVTGIPRNAGYDPSRFPVDAVQALERDGVVPSGPVFSTAIWGGYLILTWPEARVYVDGRTDMYGDDAMARWGEIYSALPGWQRRLDEGAVTIAILPRDAPLAQALGRDAAWQRWYEDATAIVYRRSPAQGQTAPESTRGVPSDPTPALDSAPAAFSAVIT